ncbi:diguanylate cyclase [Aromatoleum petrolei]|uniref:diguanylate cyclase n=1 Tax=Aromatoleum petrolei TaxID=76116 RepID=A0ABX1MX66_9RHOO|nr:diguanylate cyclase [Aromatoleum petrolei]NMF91153.1 diguanylate cyclase [Aromatoleum petrolei]QTQ37613.1 Putative diguanylate cyclase/phosphodiesterase [Aromatoleum petrolei]
MNLNRKMTLLFGGIAVGTLVMLILISLYAFRSYSIASSTAHVRTAAEVVRVHLTEAMIQGVIDKREQFLNRLVEVQGLRTARVVRSLHVNEQFGAGMNREMNADEIEKLVLADGQPRYEIRDEAGDSVFRGTIPFAASSRGTPNCLQCHKVSEGTVLGAVTMELSLSELKAKALTTVTWISITMAVFAALSIVLARRLILPVGSTAQAVERAVQRALKGDFKGRVEKRTDDEIGQIASETNNLLTFLDDGLARISQRVVQLTGRTLRQDDNQLEVAIDMVNGLADASSFKQAIEEDETKSEIFDRFGRVLTDQFGVREFSIYETSGPKQLEPFMVDGVQGSPCRWCDPQILVRSDMCRAKRSGHAVDGLTQPGICYAFKQPEEAGEMRRHYCVPIMQSGSVGSIVQIVVRESEAARFHAQVPYVNVYVREMAPVLEAKRLTETLRESSLRDAMTGLNNRRFLEEYVDTLVATARRRKTELAILVLDIDYFKMVNDTYGHDAGDAVLKSMAAVLRTSVRASDMVIRFGGEEFLIVLQETEADNALRVAENIRATVEELKIQVGGAILKKTISIGLAMFPEDSETFWQSVKFADVALYRAKEEGRNRVVRFRPEMWEGHADSY